MGERLDSTGLTYFWGKIKSYISGKIVDNLTSTSATDALSANQGRVLNGAKPNKWYINNNGARNTVLHSEMVSVRAAMSTGDTATISYYDGTNFYFGMVVKTSTAVICGMMYKIRSTNGFYFRDSSNDAAATSTDF